MVAPLIMQMDRPPSLAEPTTGSSRITDPVSALGVPAQLLPILFACEVRTIADLLWLSEQVISGIDDLALRDRVWAIRHLARTAVAERRVVIDVKVPWNQVLGPLPPPVPRVFAEMGLTSFADVLCAMQGRGAPLRTLLPKPLLLALRERLMILQSGCKPMPLPKVEPNHPRRGRTDIARIIERLNKRGIDLSAPWTELLGVLPVRAYNALVRFGAESLFDVVNALSEGQLRQMANFGRVSERMLLTALEGLLSARTQKPRSIAELLEQALYDPGLEPEERQLIEERVLSGRSLRQMAGEWKLSAERIRQMEASILQRISRRHGPMAHKLTAPLRQAMRSSGGLLYQGAVKEQVGEGDLRRVYLTLLLAGDKDFGILLSAFLYLGPRREILERLRLLRMDLGDSVSDAVLLKQRAAGKVGLFLDMDAAVELCKLMESGSFGR